MDALLLGILAVFAFLFFLGLFFWSSGALVIHQDEKEIIDSETPSEIADEIIEEAKREEAAIDEQRSNYDHSRG